MPIRMIIENPPPEIHSWREGGGGSIFSWWALDCNSEFCMWEQQAAFGRVCVALSLGWEPGGRGGGGGSFEGSR